MPYDPEVHHRRSIRLRGYDYAEAGAYFVTIVAQGRGMLFGEVIDGLVRPSTAGLMVSSWWEDIPSRFPGVDLDAFVVMPNHFHGIVVLGTDPTIDVRDGRPGGHAGPPLHDPSAPHSNPGDLRTGVGAARRGRPAADRPARDGTRASFSDIIGWFKTMATNDFIRGVREHDWPPFDRRLWQRNYHEHIIRTERSLEEIRRYVEGNPAAWADDPENVTAAR